MSLSISDFFILASVIQGISIGLAILCAPFFRSKTNNYLAGFILTLSGMTFLGWQEFDGFWPDYIWSLMWEFLVPVFLFQYFLRVLNHPYLRARWLPWLYAPFAFFLTIDLIVDFDFAFGLYQLPFPEDNPVYDFYDAFLDTLALWWNILIVTWVFRIAWNDNQAPTERRSWLVRFGIAMLVVLAIWFLSDAVQARTQIEDPFATIWIAMSLLFWWIAYTGVYQLRILEERTEIHDLLMRRVTAKQLARVDPVVTGKNLYTSQLSSLMTEDHLYRNPDLGRQLIANRLGISEGYVTQVLQDGLGIGFVDYVNGYRIAAAQEMLLDEAFVPFSLEAIGQEAGFKSRSAFYEAFKKATGKTPGRYRKSQKAS